MQEDAWRELSSKYEVMAFDKIASVESDHLLFLLLTIPLVQHSGKSLLQLALEQKRIEFLHNDRVNSLIGYLYHQPFLRPEKEIEMDECSLEYWGMLQLVCKYPFKFYLSAQGMYDI